MISMKSGGGGKGGRTVVGRAERRWVEFCSQDCAVGRYGMLCRIQDGWDEKSVFGGGEEREGNSQLQFIPIDAVPTCATGGIALRILEALFVQDTKDSGSGLRGGGVLR